MRKDQAVYPFTHSLHLQSNSPLQLELFHHRVFRSGWLESALHEDKTVQADGPQLAYFGGPQRLNGRDLACVTSYARNGQVGVERLLLLAKPGSLQPPFEQIRQTGERFDPRGCTYPDRTGPLAIGERPYPP